MTLFVVPKSIPATVALPRKPILAITPHTRMTRPIKDGSSASIPPEGASEPCFFSDLDFRNGLLVVLDSGDGTEDASLSRFLRRVFVVLLTMVVVFSSFVVVRHMQVAD